MTFRASVVRSPTEESIQEEYLPDYTEINVQPTEIRPTTADTEYRVEFKASITSSKRCYFKEEGLNITFYRINIVCTKTSIDGSTVQTIEYENRRRYSEFLALYEGLTCRHPHLKFDKFPPKRNDSEADDTIKERIIGLNAFLQYVLDHPELAQDPAVIKFLDKEKPIPPTKKVQQKTWFDTFIDYAAMPFIALENRFNTDRMQRRHPDMFQGPTSPPKSQDTE